MNSFNKEERVAFEKLLEGFEDALVMSKAVSIFRSEETMMERTGDTIWRPMPYIMPSHDGRDQTGNFLPNTQRSVPSSIGYEKSCTFTLSATELRDASQEGRLSSGGQRRLASDINVAVATVARDQGTIIVTKSSAAALYDDIAKAEAAFNRVGIPRDDRFGFLSTFDYNGLAAALAGKADMGAAMSRDAWRNSSVGRTAGFDLRKLDYALQLPAAAGGAGLTVDTRATASNYYTPVATKISSGAQSNVDNRYQTITISSTTSVVAGDAFTIAGVEEAHHETKLATGELKTFRVIEVPSSTTLVISPPIISNQGATRAEEQYQNVVVTTSATAAIVFLNTVKKNFNPIWHRDAIELMPSRYVIPKNSGVGFMRSSTAQGIEVTMTKWFDIKTYETFYRMDVRFGVTMVQPEMAGGLLFSQT